MNDSEPGIGHRFNTDFSFVCPFCGWQCEVASSEYGVLHIEPACETFMALEPDEFLHAVNMHLRSKN